MKGNNCVLIKAKYDSSYRDEKETSCSSKFHYILFALYSFGAIPVCFLKYRPKNDWSGKLYRSAISFSERLVDCKATLISSVRNSSMISLAEI